MLSAHSLVKYKDARIIRRRDDCESKVHFFSQKKYEELESEDADGENIVPLPRDSLCSGRTVLDRAMSYEQTSSQSSFYESTSAGNELGGGNSLVECCHECDSVSALKMSMIFYLMHSFWWLRCRLQWKSRE